MMFCSCDGVFEIASEYLLRFENVSYLLIDHPDLVEATFNKLEEIIYTFYQNIIDLENVGGIFHNDDLGFKTSTFLSPSLLRRLVLPRYKKYAFLAHEKRKIYWFHRCSNVLNIMKDLI